MKSSQEVNFVSIAIPTLLLTVIVVGFAFAVWWTEFSLREEAIKHEIALNFASDKWKWFHSGDITQCVLASRFDRTVPCTTR